MGDHGSGGVAVDEASVIQRPLAILIYAAGVQHCAALQLG
jgi:hypothetical protein